MKYTLIAVVAFIIVVYVYTFIKHRKRKNRQTSTVKEFRNKYLKNKSTESENIPEGYTRYLSKYNSPIDYVEKKDFLKEVNDAQTTKSSYHNQKFE